MSQWSPLFCTVNLHRWKAGNTDLSGKTGKLQMLLDFWQGCVLIKPLQAGDMVTGKYAHLIYKHLTRQGSMHKLAGVHRQDPWADREPWLPAPAGHCESVILPIHGGGGGIKTGKWDVYWLQNFHIIIKPKNLDGGFCLHKHSIWKKALGGPSGPHVAAIGVLMYLTIRWRYSNRHNDSVAEVFSLQISSESSKLALVSPAKEICFWNLCGKTPWHVRWSEC